MSEPSTSKHTNEVWCKRLDNLPPISLGTIYRWIGNDRNVDKGYKFFVEEYVADIWILAGAETFTAKAACHRSQRKKEKAHRMRIQISHQGTVFSSICSCEIGCNGKCSHITAFLYKLHDLQVRNIREIPAETSCTSKEQQWHKPRGSTISSEPVLKCVFAKAETDQNDGRTRSPIKARLYDARRGQSLEPTRLQYSVAESEKFSAPFNYLLSDVGQQQSMSTVFGDVPIGSPLSYQLQDFSAANVEIVCFNIGLCSQVVAQASPVPMYPSLPISVILPNFLLALPEGFKRIADDLPLSLADAHLLECQTVQQNKCKLWHDNKAKRITSSNFGQILNRRMHPSVSFMNSIFSKSSLEHVKSVSHGLRNEDVARKLYVKKMKKRLGRDVEVYSCGLVVNPGLYFLGASPDGKVFDRHNSDPFGLMEIKCPFKYRNYSIKNAALNPDFYLEHVGNEILLKRNHNYFYQIQGQMALSGIKWCDFIVYTFTSLFIERVAFDEKLWAETMLPCLTNFYINHSLPFLNEKYPHSADMDH